MSSGATVHVGELPRSSVARLAFILLVLSSVLFFGAGVGAAAPRYASQLRESNRWPATARVR